MGGERQGNQEGCAVTRRTTTICGERVAPCEDFYKSQAPVPARHARQGDARLVTGFSWIYCPSIACCGSLTRRTCPTRQALNWMPASPMAIGRRTEAFRPGTVANQHSLALLYFAFTIYFRFVDLPASERTLLCFAEFLLHSFAATKSVMNAPSAVKRLHLDLGFSTVAFDAPAVECWKRALLTTVRWVPRQAPPLPLRVLRELSLATFALESTGRAIRALFMLLFHSMTRLSSLLPPSEMGFDHTWHACLGDFTRRGGQWWFRGKWAKTHLRADQGYWVPLLLRPGTGGLPVGGSSCLVAREIWGGAGGAVFHGGLR